MYSNNAMEIRRQTHGKGKLETVSCISNDYGFAVCSLIVLGQKEAAVVDTQWTRANAYRVVAEIIESGRDLKAVIISHAHPDHYFGAEVYHQAFPNAIIYAMPEDIPVIEKEMQGKKDYWQDEAGMNKHNIPQTDGVPLTPLEGESVYIEGQEIHIYKKCWGDLKYNTMTWIPSISTLYGSDILFSNAHPFTCEVSAKGRAKWKKELDRFEAFNAEVVIPGHAKWGEPFDGRSFEFTRSYIDATEEELAKTNDIASFYYNMMIRFPDALLLRSDEMNSNVFKGTREWYFSDDGDD